jgi:uncharacterized protein
MPGSPAVAQPAASPSFDCAKASGQVESLICRDAGLTGLDRRMADVYATALRRWPPETAGRERAAQREWLRVRNNCSKEKDVRACVELSYRTRLVEIQSASGQLQPPASSRYQCAGAANRPLVATFYRDTDPSSAVISYGDDKVIVFVAPSGSGARYTASGVEFWEHQGEATVSWYGRKLTCRPQAPARVP